MGLLDRSRETLVQAWGERGWRDVAVAILATSACGYGQCGNSTDESLHPAVVHLHNAKSFSRRPRPRPDRGRLWSGKGKLKPDSSGIVIINPLTDRYGPPRRCRTRNAHNFCSAVLALRGRGPFRDDDVAAVARLALVGIVHESATGSEREI